MVKLRCEVHWTIASRTFVLDDYEMITVRRSADLKNSKVDVTLKNNLGTFEPYINSGSVAFQADQTLEVYAKNDSDGSGLDTAAGSDDLLFSGRVTRVSHEEGDKQTLIKVTAADTSFIMLNKLWVGSETDTVDELVIKVSDFVNNNVSNSWDTISASSVTSGGEVSDTRSDGSAFPSYTLSKVFKPASEVLQHLSQPSVTGEVAPYRIHIDKNNVLHWFYPSDNAAHIINVGTTAPQTVSYTSPITGSTVSDLSDSNSHYVINYSLEQSPYDVINYIIYKAGVDMEGEQVLYYAFDPTSGAPIVKDSFRNYEEIARDMKEEDRRAGNITRVREDEYNYPGSYPVTPAWKSTSGSVASDSAYNDAFILEARRRADSYCEAIFKQFGSPRLKGKIVLRGENSFEANDGLWFRAENTGIPGKFLRITDVQHNITNGGWNTTLQVEEEVPLF